MAYAVPADLRARLGEVFDAIYGAGDPPPAAAQENAQEEAGEGGQASVQASAPAASGPAPEELAAEDLADAQAEIDGALARRYAVPVSTAGSATLAALLKGWCLTLAEERCYARAAGSAYADKVKERCALVRKCLQDASDGRFLLPGAEENTGGSVAFVQTDRPLFTRTGLEGY